MAKRAAGASSAHVAQATRDALARGNAVDAVVAGLLAAAAESPSVLLGPVQVLMGGAGVGLLAIDGRVRQAGIGVPRPRGVLAGEAIPPQARVGVSAFPAALAAALASSGRTTLRRAAAPAIEGARAVSPERAAVLESVARYGAAALAQDALAVELLAVAGRASGGTLTREDLAEVRPAIVSCDVPSHGLVTVPWQDRSAEALDAASTHVVAAIDSRGLAAAACYEAPVEGLAIPTLGLVAPLLASPVMRGEARVRPGEVRPAPAPIGLCTVRGLMELAFGIGQLVDAKSSMRRVSEFVSTGGKSPGDFFSKLEGSWVAVTRAGDSVAVFASA